MTIGLETSGKGRGEADEATGLQERIRLMLVDADRPITARELARALGAPKEKVNSELYRATDIFRKAAEGWCMVPGLDEKAHRSAAVARPFEGSDLFYEASGRLVAVPDWANYFMMLGAATALRSSREEVPVTAISAPAAGFAAALIALGVGAQRSWSRGEFSAHEHFLALCRASAGTPATYHDGRKIYRGVLAGTVEMDGLSRVGIRIDRSNVRWLPERECARIQISAGSDDFEVPDRGHGRAMSPASAFVSAALNGGDAVRHAGEDSTDVMIVGVLHRLESECLPELFDVYSGGGVAPDSVAGASSWQRGSLQSVLRVRRLLSGAGQHYRSQFLPSSASDPGGLSSLRGVPVILDGSGAYLRWRQTWRGAPTVVVLDRTDSGSGQAGEAFSQEYEMDRLDDEDPMGDLPVITGVERLSFWRRART